jgi:mannose-6-phosphate isomerase
MAIRPRVVDKPWGHELIWAETELYVGKILHVKAGEALSVQMHEKKDETLHLLKGEMILSAGPSPEELEPVPFREGDSFRVKPGTVHVMEAVTDVDVLEASTAHLDDVVRFTDRYGRASADKP